MNRYSIAVVWFNRAVLSAAIFIMLMIATRNLRDPVAATQPFGMLLQSPTAMTVARVGFGGFPFGFALALIGCLISRDRVVTGLALVLTIIGAVTLARIQGIVVDGATDYNLHLLRPEFTLLTLSAIGFVLGRREAAHAVN